MFWTYFKIKKIAFSWFLMLFLSMVSYATNALADIPLITDDTGTQGKGKSQIEIFGEYVYDKEEGVKTKETDLAATFYLWHH